MFWPKGEYLVYVSTNLPKLSTNFLSLFHNVSNMTWITPSLNCKYLSIRVHTSHQPYGIHLLHCVHGNERTRTHDVIHNTFVAIAWDVSFHMGRKQLHVLNSNMFNFAHRRVDIVLTKDGIRTLVNVVIANPTRANLLPWSCATRGFVTSNATQTEKQSYRDRHLTNQFLPLVVEVFGCLHKQADMFLHNCANAIWSLKRLEGLPLPVLVTFLQQKNSITLQRLQASSILSQAIVVGLPISQLPPLQNRSPISITDLL